MAADKKAQEKENMHPRNKNRGPYDLDALKKTTPELAQYVQLNKYGNESVDFSDPKAVRALNKALLHYYYGVEFWDFPESRLCPPIPGRADYLHYIADLLADSNGGEIPKGADVRCLDVGVGANCIYPAVGVAEYGWSFVASDVDEESLDAARAIVDENAMLKDKVECCLQGNEKRFFENVILDDEQMDVSICNPPFHASAEEAVRGTRRKVKNLSGKREKEPKLNFSGVSNELIYNGGEFRFINDMIYESRRFATKCLWFTSLVSKQKNMESLLQVLNKTGVKDVKVIEMGTGNKVSRILAWSFVSKKERGKWFNGRF